MSRGLVGVGISWTHFECPSDSRLGVENNRHLDSAHSLMHSLLDVSSLDAPAADWFVLNYHSRLSGNGSGVAYLRSIGEFKRGLIAHKPRVREVLEWYVL